MKIKLGELQQWMSGFNYISKLRFRAIVSIQLRKLYMMLLEEFKAFEEERIKLVKSYAKKDDKGEPVIENGNFILADPQAFAKEFTELQNLEIEIDFKKIPIKIKADMEIEPFALDILMDIAENEDIIER